MMLAALLQPLSANDIVAIVAVTGAVAVAIIKALKPTQTAADAKVDNVADVLKSVMDQQTTLTAAVQQLSLHTPAPQQPPHPGLVDTVAGLPVVEAPAVVTPPAKP